MNEQYWGRPIPGWGDSAPSILIVGLAPAAHGGNRTGRIFTGDRSGDFLFASLHRCGLASLPTSESASDGQRLSGARMAAAVRCAPPGNKPTPGERDSCAPWLAAELRMVAASLRVIVCLGGFRMAGALAGAARGRLSTAETAAGLRARQGSRTSRRAGKPGGRPADRVLPPEPAEHVHRPRHGRDVRRDFPARPGSCRSSFICVR